MSVVLHSLTLQDAKLTSTGRVKNRQNVAVYVPLGAQTIADLTAWSAAFAEAVDNVTEAEIVGVNITLFPDLPGGLKSSPVAGSDVQEGGLITFDLTGSDYTDAVRIPAYLGSLFAADGQTIPDSGATNALVDLLIGVDGVIDTAASNRFEVEYLGYLTGKKSFRK